MAYMDKEKKKAINEQLKKVLPEGWKATLRIDNYSTIVCTIRKAPVDLLREIAENIENQYDFNSIIKQGYYEINHYCPQKYFSESLDTIKKIITALNHQNYDKSDSQRDHFDVGYYVNLSVGRSDSPFLKNIKNKGEL